MSQVHPSGKYEKFSSLSDRQITDILGFFPTNAHLYCYLASVGFKKGKREKTAKPNPGWGDVPERIFRNQGLLPQVYTIALAETKDYEILKDLDQCFSIFEEYVNAGFFEIKKISKNSNTEEEFVDLLLQDLIDTAQKNKKSEIPENNEPVVLNIED